MIQRFLLPGVALVALATCASTPNTTYYGRGMCEPRKVVSPDGVCEANIRQFWGESTYAQVIVGCRVEGVSYGAVATAYKEHAEYGIGLHWLSNDKLEIAVAPGADAKRVAQGKWFSDTHIEVDGRNQGDTRLHAPESDAALVRTITFSHRDLTPKDPEWKRGCYTKRPKTKS